MSRSLIIGIIATFVLFGGIATFFYLNNIRVKNRPVTDAVPNDAFLILQSDEMQEQWLKLNQSDLWKDLQGNMEVRALTERIRYTDSILALNPDAMELINGGHQAAISFHFTSYERLSMLYIFETGKKIDVSAFASWIASQAKGSVVKRNFEKEVVFDVLDAQKLPLLSLAYKEQLLICSFDGSLVEESIRKLKYHIPNSTKGFKEVTGIAEVNEHLSMYINYQTLPKLFALFSKPEYAGMFDYMKSFANWSIFDVEFQKEQFNISGVTLTDDSVFQFIDLFKNQVPQKLQLQKLVPANTSFMLQMGFSDYMKFNADLNEYLQAHDKSNSYTRFADSLETRYGIDITQSVLPYIDGEAALVMIEPPGSDYHDHMAAIIRFKDPNAMGNALNNFVLAMDKKGEADSVNINYNGYTIEQIKLGNFLKLYYGEIFESISSPYFTKLEETFVFANSLQTLQHILDSYLAKKTLDATPSFKAHASGLTSTANISIFISPQKNLFLPSDYVKEEMLSSININQFDLRKFEYFSMQLANTNNSTFYTNIHYRFATSTDDEVQQLWATKLDTAVASQPAIVYHAALKQNCILVQDAANTLYMVSNTGTVLWKTKIQGRINGSIHQLDVLKNGTVKYLFSTDKQACLIDENGSSLYGFPVRFPGTAVAPLTLTDLYHDSAWQFYVPLENKRIVGYAINGKVLQGRAPKITDEKIMSPLRFIEKRGKIMMYATDAKGRLQLYDQKGKTVSHTISTTACNFFYKEDDDSMQFRFTAIDSLGLVTYIICDTALKPVHVENKLFGFEVKKLFSDEDDVTQNRMVLFQSAGHIKAADMQARTVLDEAITDTLDVPHSCFITDHEGRLLIGTIQAQSRQIRLYHADGKLWTGFPVNGNSLFTIGKVHADAARYLVTGDTGNKLVLYRLK